jgi:hypothetical protein
LTVRHGVLVLLKALGSSRQIQRVDFGASSSSGGQGDSSVVEMIVRPTRYGDHEASIYEGALRAKQTGRRYSPVLMGLGGTCTWLPTAGYSMTRWRDEVGSRARPCLRLYTRQGVDWVGATEGCARGRAFPTRALRRSHAWNRAYGRKMGVLQVFLISRSALFARATQAPAISSIKGAQKLGGAGRGQHAGSKAWSVERRAWSVKMHGMTCCPAHNRQNRARQRHGQALEAGAVQRQDKMAALRISLVP